MSFNTPRNIGGSSSASGFRPSLHSYDDSDPWASPSRVAANAGAHAASGSASDPPHSSRPLTWSGSEVSGMRNGGTGTSAIPNGTFPPIYDTAWQMAGHGATGGGGVGATAVSEDDAATDSAETDISLGQVHRLVASSGLNASMVEQIINMACDRSRASKSEFAVALALVALAQSHQDLDVPAMRELERTDRSALPIPQLSLSTLQGSGSSYSNGARPSGPSRQTSDVGDPWRASSILYNGSAARDGLPASSTGLTYSYSAGKEGVAGDAPSVGFPEHEATDGFASVPGLGSSCFLDDDAPAAAGPSSTLSTAIASSDPPSLVPPDQISVRLRAELEGFIFKHNLYIVTSRRRASEVTRRYSDFVWLSESLGKRYPFRLLPILPPKRLSLPVPGRSMSGDDEFVEKRRRGLVRFLRALTAHPVLSVDPLVQVFLTERSSLAEWRAIKPAPILEEEGLLAAQSDSADANASSAPPDFDEKLASLRTTTQHMLERWTSLCLIFERITKRADAAAADWMRFSFAIDSLRETSSSAAARELERDRRQQARAEETMKKVSSACQDFGDLLGARSLAMTTTTLEGLKAQRDLWAAFRDLLVRHDKLGGDSVEALRRRIDATNKRHGAARSERRPGWEAECDRMASAVKADQKAIEVALRRRAHTRRAVEAEIRHLHAASTNADAEWRAYARREHVHAAANVRAAEELHLVLENV